MPASSRLRPFDGSMIVQYLKTTPARWAEYHRRLVGLRNDRLAHFDPKGGKDELPNLTWAMHSAYLYREWLILLLRAYRESGVDIQITDTSSNAMLMLFKQQISEICVARVPATS